MPMALCPNCNERIVRGRFDIDFEHRCNSGDTVLDQEDIVNIGNATEFGGTVTTNSEINFQGIENTLWGTDGDILGEKAWPLTERGNRASTHRQRQKFTFIRFEDGKVVE